MLAPATKEEVKAKRNYELAKQLKDAGFPQSNRQFYWKTDGAEPYLVLGNSRYIVSKGTIECAGPTLSEVIEACIWAGISRDTYNEYKKHFPHAMRAAEGFIENAWVQRLAGTTPTGAIFFLKNAFCAVLTIAIAQKRT